MSELKTLEAYTFDNHVQAYLSEFPFLEQALEEGYQHMIRLFGDDTEIVLKVVVDHEIPDYRTLFAFIWTELEVDDALARLDQLDEEWYTHLPYAVRSKFNTNIR